jgi:hypothetical protein
MVSVIETNVFMMYRFVVVIIGSKDWCNYDMIYNKLKSYVDINSDRDGIETKDGGILFIHGACQGADLLGERAAKSLGFDIFSKPAEWGKYGKVAGPIRNRDMVDILVEYKKKGSQTIVIGFHNSLQLSKGTKNCVDYAIENGLDVVVYKNTK